MTPGEQVVTLGSNANPRTGLDQPFVPEIPIGHVSFVAPTNGGLSITGKVMPYVDYGALDVVGVVVEAPRSKIKPFSLVPASPTPAPTVTVTKTVTPTPDTTGSPSISGTP